jgi:hypothetical protein
VRRGLAGNWTWLLVAACAFVLRRSLNDKGGVVSTLKISPGEQVLISVRDPKTPLTAPDGAATTHFDES